MAATTPPPDPALEQARALLDAEELGLAALAARVGMGGARLQRAFRNRYGLTPAAYLAERKLASLKAGLRAGRPVSDALYDAGYGSPSRVYGDRAARLGMTPATYRAGGAGEAIRWSHLQTGLGAALVATTARGICMVELGQHQALLEARLQAEFPKARLERVDAGSDEFLAPRVGAVAAALARHADKPGPQPSRDPDTPELDLLGTAFQRRVWEALMQIPAGRTRSYAEVATDLGLPGGARAIAGACARNRVAIIVPCHRVIRGDGSLGGYRWGLPIKQALLQHERA